MENFIKGKTDKLNYRIVELPSRLRAILVSDVETNKSTATAVVQTGSLQDPKSHQGMAHFLEHMLFMGSKSYPETSTYMNFVSQAGGYTNAYTADTHTCYYFTIPNAQYENALDMFSEFFFAPLLRPDNVEKELQAVHSEHEKNINSDDWRRAQLLKTLANPESQYYNTFGTGSLATLQTPDVHERMKEFYEATYSANLITVCLYSNKSLEELEALLHAKFAAVSDKSISGPSFAASLPFFTAAQLGRKLCVKTISEQRQLTIYFLCRPLEGEFRHKPLDIVNQLIGHEGEGSIFARLVEERLAYELSAGKENIADAHTFAMINVKLTHRGFEQVERVLLIIGQYLQNLKGHIPEWFFEECRRIDKLRFDFRSKQSESGHSVALACDLATYPADYVLYHSYYLESYAPNLYSEILAAFRLENAILMVSSNEFGELPLREPVYGTEHSIETISADLISRFGNPQLDAAETLRLPPPNPFIPTRFDLKEGEESEHPKRIPLTDRSECGELFFLKNTKFGVPKAQITYQFNTHTFRDESDSAVELYARIWCALLNERIKPHTYLADMAGIRFELRRNARGFQMKIWGFDDSLHVFLVELATQIQRFAMPPSDPTAAKALAEGFETKKAEQREKLDKQIRGNLYKYVLEEYRCAMQTGRSSVSALLAELETLNFEGYLAFHSRATAQLSFEGFISGNVLAEEAVRLHCAFFDALGAALARPLDSAEVAQTRVPALQLGRRFMLHQGNPISQDANNCGLIVFQGTQEEHNRPLLMLTRQLIDSLFFDELRTRQQLGYVVLTLEQVIGGVLHYAFQVQSTKICSHEIIKRIMANLDAVREQLKALTAAEFDQARDGLIAELSQPFFSLRDEHDHFFEQIYKHIYAFGWRENAAKMIGALELPTFLAFFEQFFFTERKALELHFTATTDSAANERALAERFQTEIALISLRNARVLQSLLPLYPDVYVKLRE